MGKFYKMPENKEIIFDSDNFYKLATDFQIDGLHAELHLEIEKRQKRHNENE